VIATGPVCGGVAAILLALDLDVAMIMEADRVASSVLRRKVMLSNVIEGDGRVDLPGTSADDLTDPRLYINFQLSWLAFNERVMEEAEDPSEPLLERAKFLAIVSTNNDEFFMIRVAALQEGRDTGSGPMGDDGLTPTETLVEINRRSQALAERQLRCFRTEVAPALAREHIHLLDYNQLDEQQRAALRVVYKRDIEPVLTPLAVDPAHPFPFISNQSLSLLVVLGDGDGDRVARVRMPASLPRLVSIEPGPAQGSPPDGGRAVCFTWLEQVVAANIQSLFDGIPVQGTYPFRVIRNADLEIEEDEAADLLQDVKAMLRARPFGFVTCLTLDRSMPIERRSWLAEKLRVDPEGILLLDSPLGLGDLISLLSLDRPDLKDPPLLPRTPAALSHGADLFEAMRHGDILLHHPYDSFEPVVRLVSTPADARVLAIKQTLYRVGGNSPIVRALADSRDANTEVAVVVELKARFDEESNVGWAEALESRGVHVVYGVPGLKVHCKLAMVVRRDDDGQLRRYLHLGTGNYNASTARLYTDLALLTTRPELGEEVAELFNSLTGYSDKRDYQYLLVSPVTLRQRMASMIEREAELARRGEPARLMFKMNQLTDGPMIRALYRAAQARVQVDLLVRGVCCLRPGLPGVSETIRVSSIVGRFLEHGRIYYFQNGGAEEVYLGSADLMPRNLDRRVEVLFPVADPVLRDRLRDKILGIELADTVKARRLRPDGTYERVRPADGAEPLDSQAWFLAHDLDAESVAVDALRA
jgi:polyphosphate kinase